MRTVNPVLVCSLLLIAGAAAGDDSVSATKAGKSVVLAQLAGKWDVRYEFVDKAGRQRVDNGQVTYTWILDGKALQEVWTSDSENKGKEARPFGTSINFFDPKQQHWTAVWVYPAQGETWTMSGGDVDGQFVMTGHDMTGALQRWTTRIASPDTVIGRFDISHDEGKTWKEVGLNQMQRVPGEKSGGK